MNTWWTVMVVIGAANWIAALYILSRSFSWKRPEPEDGKYINILRVCGIIFTTVALYRSIFVSSYPDRLAWFDSLLNSPFLIRSFAMLAELSFILIIATILVKVSGKLGMTGSVLSKGPYIAAGCIFVAQFFAFGGLITQSQTLFAVEESLWALTFISIFPLVITGLRKAYKGADIGKMYKGFLIIMTIWCSGYLAFQLFYALPFIYIAGIAQDAGLVVPADALKQAIWNYRATRDFNEWGGIGFFIWHSGYFSLCSWMVLYFMAVPRKTLRE